MENGKPENTNVVNAHVFYIELVLIPTSRDQIQSIPNNGAAAQPNVLPLISGLNLYPL